MNLDLSILIFMQNISATFKAQSVHWTKSKQPLWSTGYVCLPQICSEETQLCEFKYKIRFVDDDDDDDGDDLK